MTVNNVDICRVLLRCDRSASDLSRLFDSLSLRRGARENHPPGQQTPPRVIILHVAGSGVFKMAAVFKPIVRWAQSKERLFLTLELTDVQVCCMEK